MILISLILYFRCDIICVLFENDEKALEFLGKYGRLVPLYIPKLLVKTKTDISDTFNAETVGNAIFLQIQNKDIAQISVKNKEIKDLVEKLFAIIDNP